jgi:hypothetical protein
MRRLLTAVALGASLLVGAGCAGQDNDEPSGAEPTTAAPTSASPTPSASPSANYAADTKRICTEIDKALDSEMEKFGVEVGKMIAYKQSGNTTEANQAKAAAQAQLRAIAARMSQRTAAAQDPELKAAGEESAKNIAASAADNTFFSRLKSLNDVQTVVEREAVTWLVPLAEFCA